MSIQIYNTMKRTKEEFVPIEEGKVRMYVCGPTVYDYLHIGNFVGAIFFNLVRNWLEKRGYEVTYVYNYTDVDDKIIKRSLEDNVPSSEISEKYIAEFEKDFKSLGLRPHTKNPRVTEHMQDIIEFIADLVKNEKAYAVGGDVYFSVEAFKDYGKLTNKNLDELLTGTRAEVSDVKKHVADFALWKAAKDGEPSWDSPWGKGRPGWHIECSAMNHAIFGDQIDIHGGGMDLMFPHHENEIAQSEAKSGKCFAKYWMHNNMLEFGNVKMSKSLGNVKTGRGFIEEFSGEVLKFMILSSHYRSTIDFSQKQIDRSINNLSRFYSALSHASELKSAGGLAPVPALFEKRIHEADEKIAEALDNDFSMPEVMAEFYEVMKLYNNLCHKPGKPKPEQIAVAETFYAWLRSKGEVMALFQQEPGEFLRTLDDILLAKKDVKRADVDQLVADRTKAREAKDWAKSDEIRDKLVSMGISLQDSAAGTHWEVDKAAL